MRLDLKNKLFKIAFPCVLSLIISAAFIAGCSLSSYDWFVKTVKKHYFYPVDDSAFEGDDLKEIAGRTLDKYSAYYTAEEYKNLMKSNSGSKSGIGISYSFAEGKGIYISSVIGNSPAYISGLRAGEWIESASLGGETAVFEKSSDFADFVNSAKEEEKINLNSSDGKVYTVSKSEYTASYTYMASNDNAWIFSSAANGGLAVTPLYSEIIPELPDGTAYINISQFYGTASREFDILVNKFNAEKFTSLIIDLRSNGGGYVNVMQDMAYAFSNNTKTLAMLSRDKKGREEKFYCTKVSPNASVLAQDTKIYVLANSGTASASEALIGAMICYGRREYENIFLSDYSEEYLGWLQSSGQEIKNARSYGKGIMQSTFVNSFTKEALKLTTAQIYWPDEKTCIHDKGVTAEDGCTPVPAQWERTKGDEELKAVIEIIRTRT